VEQLVGREAELQSVRDAVEGPAPVAIVLEGEAGIGKTALWHAGIATGRERGMRVLVARPAEAETGLSHAALGDLLGPLVEGLPADFPPPQRRALDVALLRTAAAPGPLDPRAVGAATLGALRAAGASAPVLVAVDDIQWLDPASAAALRFAFRRIGDDDKVLLLATRRTGERGADVIDFGIAEWRLTRIAVGPLGPRALKRMVHTRLGESMQPSALARMTEIAGGNPYFALELGRAALRRGGGAEVPLPKAISAALDDRLRALPRETRDALVAVAAMGHPTVASVSAVLDPGTLDAAFEAGVLDEQGDAIRFDHPLLAEAAYRMLPPARRRAVHQRLADATTDREERARHLAAATTASDAAVAAAIQKGAEAAAERGALVAAGELLEASARLEPDFETAARRRITAVGHYVLSREPELAAALGRDVLRDLPHGPLRSRALTVMAQLEGDVAEVVDLINRAVEEAGDDREALLQALMWQAYMLEVAGREDEGYDALLRARELLRPDDPRMLRVMVVTAYAHFAELRGDPAALRLLEEAAALEGDDLIPSAGWGAGSVFGRCMMSADRLEAARPMLEDRLRRAEDVGDDEGRVSLLVFLSELEVRAGRLDAALAHGQEATAIQESRAGGLTLVVAYRGDLELAREVAERTLATSEAYGDTILMDVNRAVLGFVEFSRGDHAAAVDWFSHLMRRFLTGRAGDPGLRDRIHLPEAIEALIALGRLSEAEQLLAAWERAGERFDRPRIHATAARCRALLAAAEGDLDVAIGRAEAALEHHRDLPVPFERARTLIVVGTLHRRAKHKAAARDALQDALEILDGMGARVWADRARAELGRIGGRAAADGLTPSEQRVADLVAEGRSNKEVAGELFVSVRTVEANLTRVYAKLGIRSRSELAATRQASDGRSRSPAPPPAQRS
jgi:DNA-binding CsgD family transcriptional regulator